MGRYGACMGERSGRCRVLVGKVKVRDHFEDLAVDVKVILK
jgi:hypothetical protein